MAPTGPLQIDVDRPRQGHAEWLQWIKIVNSAPEEHGGSHGRPTSTPQLPVRSVPTFVPRPRQGGVPGASDAIVYSVIPPEH